jgi:hypothetical protein
MGRRKDLPEPGDRCYFVSWEGDVPEVWYVLFVRRRGAWFHYEGPGHEPFCENGYSRMYRSREEAIIEEFHRICREQYGSDRWIRAIFPVQGNPLTRLANLGEMLAQICRAKNAPPESPAAPQLPTVGGST